MPRKAKPNAEAMASRIKVNTEGGNAYDESRRAGHKMDARTRVIVILLVVLVIAYLFGLIVPRNLLNTALHQSGYSDGYSLAWFVSDLSENVNGLFAVLVGDAQGGSSTLTRMITYVVIVLCGAGLALCGAVYQGTFRNSLVSPSTLGVMSGASLGMAVWIALFYDPGESHGLWFEAGDGAASATSALDPLMSLWNSYGLVLCTFVSCVVVVGLVVLTFGTIGKNSSSGLMMIIAGQVIAAVMEGITSSVRYYFITVDPEGPQAQMMMELQISSFYRSYSLIDVVAVGVPVLVMFAVVMAYRQQLTLLAFSEDEARAMGVETRRLRFAVIGLATLVTAVIVSFCGRVGFVGFIVPHLARRLVGPNFTYLLPATAVLGGVFVLGAYVLLNMTLGDGYATMTGMFISIAGAVVFLVTALRTGGDKRGSF